MKESNRVKSLLIGAMVVVLSTPVIVGAVPYQNDAGQIAVRVSYADLDLSSDAGVATLYQRLRGAASDACGPRRSVRAAGSLQQLVKNKACYNDLLSRLVEKIDNEKLNEIHAG